MNKFFFFAHSLTQSSFLFLELFYLLCEMKLSCAFHIIFLIINLNARCLNATSSNNKIINVFIFINSTIIFDTRVKKIKMINIKQAQGNHESFLDEMQAERERLDRIKKWQQGK